MEEVQEHPARVQVSASKKPLHFYVELAKRFLQEHGEVQLSAIGLAIPMMVNLAEILKNNQWATEIKIRTGLYQTPSEVEMPSNAVPKAKMEIVLTKSAQFDALMAGGPAAQQAARLGSSGQGSGSSGAQLQRQTHGGSSTSASHF